MISVRITGLSSNFNVRIAGLRFAAAALAIAVTVTSCGGKGPGPTPVIDPPQIACPADVTVSGVTGVSQEVTYPAPTTSRGVSPVAVTCAPASGTAFALGTTTVNCAARDAQAREAACAFRVTVNGLALGAKKFLAAGDSLTSGENGLPSFVDPPNSYPTKLQALLDRFFPGQGLSVVNRGESGQRIERTEARLPGFLLAERPDGVLLLGGYNNLTLPCGPGQANSLACEAAVDDVAFGVRDCIRRAKESPAGIRFIFVSTLTPPGTGPKRIDRDAILETNRRIRVMVSAERAILVDAYPVFVGREAEFVSVDGLHLQPAGYQALADAFFAAIRATIPQTPQLR